MDIMTREYTDKYDKAYNSRYDNEYNRKYDIRKRKSRQIRRIRRIKRLGARFATVLAILLLLFTATWSFRSFAGSERAAVSVHGAASATTEKYYTSILIYPGDSLDSLSLKYASPENPDAESLKREIASINHLSPDKPLSAGNHLIVPVYY